MAQGDIRAEIASVATGGFLSIQPAVGESWIVKDVFASGDGTEVGYFNLYDGTDLSTLVGISTTDADLNSYRVKVGNDVKLDYINNSLYISVHNDSASARKCGIIALQIK